MIEQIVQYFSDMPTLHRTLILVGGLSFFSLMESAIPLFALNYGRGKHAAINIFFTLTTIIVNFSMAFILLKASDWVTANEYGLLHIITLPLWAKLIVGLLLMDLIAAWFIHWIEHRVPWMWKFHVIHHSDQHVDTTTANRHHPGESVFRFVFTTLSVILIGAPIWLIFVYQTMSVVLTQFNHANITMPAKLDLFISYVFCTPNMHRVHHHYRQPYSDTNYGNIFSFWDRMFGTYALVDNSQLKYGVDTYMGVPESNDLWTMLKIPFQKYRPTPTYDVDEKLKS
jgi:sterol desaturase/sphingolipid hydroxylase (fatty acid hydroxylase superfamily)